MKIGLRVDVDTFRGTRDGVPALLKILSENNIRATFFFSVGPDNMGRHLWRLLKPAFFLKMLRSKAANLYGWDILLRGTFWSGPIIGVKCGRIMREAAQSGHEIGLHAWDHHKWQAQVERWGVEEAHAEMGRGFEMLSEIIGRQPDCSAAPAWKCTGNVLDAREKFPFVYNSDCRGQSVFLPVVDGKQKKQPQVPVTLPTYDEVVGRGINAESFGDFILSRLREDAINVFTIHAEVEGIALENEFMKFVQKAESLGHEFCPLGEFVKNKSDIPACRMTRGALAGREGWLSVQA